MAKRKTKRPAPAPRQPGGPQRRPGRAEALERHAWLAWLLVALAVLANLPAMTSGNYLPKFFWICATLGLGYLALPARRPARLALTAPGLVWLLYTAWALASLTWAPSTRPALERLLTLYLVPALACLLARRSRFWESDRFWLAYAALVGLVALIGIVQSIFPNAPLLGDLSGTAIPRSTLGSRNYAAMYFMLNLPLLVWTLGHFRGRRLLLCALATGAALLFLLLVRTRGAWLGVAVSLAFALALAGRPLFARAWQWRRPLAGATLILLVVLLGVSSIAQRNRTLDQLGDKARLGWMLRHLLHDSKRFDMWSEAWGVSPLLTGAGAGNFPIDLSAADRFDKKTKTLNYEVHNDYLQALVDLGLPGLALYLAFHLLLLRLIWRGRRDGLVVAAGAALGGFMVIEGTTFLAEKVSSILTLAALVAIVLERSPARPLFERPLPRALPGLARAAAGLGLLALAGLVAQSSAADRAFRATQIEMGALPRLPDFERRETLAALRTRIPRLAERTLPRIRFDVNMRHIYCHQYMTYAQRMKDLDSARRFARSALALHPTDRSAMRQLAHFELSNDRIDEALPLLEHSLEIWGPDPYSPLTRALPGVYQALGRAEDARRLTERLETHRVATPAQPDPAPRANAHPPGQPLRVAPAHAARSYTFTLWREGQTEPDRPHARGLESPEYLPPGGLRPATRYFWRVEARGEYGKATGPLWRFQTAPARGQ